MRKSLTGLLLVAVLASLSAQGAYGGGSTMSRSPAPMSSYDGAPDASSMMAPPETTAPSPAAPSMMSQAMSYEELKARGQLADTMVGASLRSAPSTGRKVAFTSLAAAQTLVAGGPVVLFFAADWCPSCQADLRDINANGAKLGKATVVVVDFDKSAELRSRFGVTVQDSFVRIDAKGMSLGAWNGGGVAGILARLGGMM